MKKPSRKAIDRQIETIYYRAAQGRSISVLDIGKVYRAGYAAVDAGQDIEAAIVAAVAELTQ